MSYFSKLRKKRRVIPDGLWIKCNGCNEIIYQKKLDAADKVCPACGYHYRLSARQRINLLTDTDSFFEFDADMLPVDPLEFVDGAPYPTKQARAKLRSGENDAAITGQAKIFGIDFLLGVMDFAYMGGSMGSVVGEKFTRLIEKGVSLKLPLVIVSSSGGVRMHEAIIGLMQMAKTSAALYKLKEAKIPFVSVLTDPTTGGTTASFASLGDVIIGEPGALIAFAGPRVIKQTIRQDLPPGFQKASFLLDHGNIDMVVKRADLKKSIGKLISYFTGTSADFEAVS